MVRINPWLKNFTSILIGNSEDKIYDKAINEWELNYTYFCTHYGDEKCICTHEIQEVCVVKNKINGNELHIGNCCIAKFNIAGGNDLIKSIRNLKKNKVNQLSIDWFFESDYIDEYDKEFLMSVRNKSYLTENQYNHRKRLMNRLREQLIRSDIYEKEWYEK